TSPSLDACTAAANQFAQRSALRAAPTRRRTIPRCLRRRERFGKEMLMMNVRNTLIGLVASALLAWIVVSCGGGGGGGYGGGSGSGGMPAPTYTVGGTLS